MKRRVQRLHFMWHLALRFWTGEQGQDLTEYSLLLAFVVLSAAAIFLVNATSIYSIWVTSNQVISNAAIVSHGS